jgi:hypothetical protein
MSEYEALARRLAEETRDAEMIRNVLVLRGCPEPYATEIARAAVKRARRRKGRSN